MNERIRNNDNDKNSSVARRFIPIYGSELFCSTLFLNFDTIVIRNFKTAFYKVRVLLNRSKNSNLKKVSVAIFNIFGENSSDI